jgi:hypothetical protein
MTANRHEQASNRRRNADKNKPRMHAKGRKFGLTPQDLSHSPLYCRLHHCQDGSASTNRLFHLGLPHSLKSSAFARPSSVVWLTPDYAGQDGATGIRGSGCSVVPGAQ